jgi:hypothetical protein
VPIEEETIKKPEHEEEGTAQELLYTLKWEEVSDAKKVTR